MQALQAKAAEITAQAEAGDDISDEQRRLLDDWDQQRAFMAPTAADVQADVAVHLGSYAEITAKRIPTAMMMQIFGTLFFGLWRVTALMLIGMALMKTGVLAAEKSTRFYRNMLLLCYGIGLPLTVFSAFDLYTHDFAAMYAFQAGAIPNYFGSIIVGLGHIAAVMLMIKSGFAQKLLRRFAAVGRMALTNYLLHSVILTTVFYGYGLGLYSSVPRFQQMGFVVAVIALQLLLSSWWLARYRFGPVEWLWRSLTYWKRQRMVR
jgi:uncharacterized protein